MSQRKEERNKKIFELYNDPSKRMSTYALAQQFHVRPSRISMIIKNEKARIEKTQKENQSDIQDQTG